MTGLPRTLMPAYRERPATRPVWLGFERSPSKNTMNDGATCCGGAIHYFVAPQRDGVVLNFSADTAILRRGPAEQTQDRCFSTREVLNK